MGSCRSSQDKFYQARAESLLAIDEMVGHLVDELQGSGALKNTFVIFSCDNGYHLGHHRLPPGKREVYQHDIRVPLMQPPFTLEPAPLAHAQRACTLLRPACPPLATGSVMGPGVVAGSTVGDLVGNYDLASTWAEIAAVTPPAAAPVVDGRSFLQLLGGRAGGMAPFRQFTLQESWLSCEAGHGEGAACGNGEYACEVGADGEETCTVLSAGAGQDPDYSAVHVPGVSTYAEFKDGGKLYFDAVNDPWQLENAFAAQPAAAQKAAAAQVAQYANCVGAECP